MNKFLNDCRKGRAVTLRSWSPGSWPTKMVLQGELVRMGEVVYQLEDGELLPLEEYLLTVAGTLQVRLLGRDKKLILMAIPAQLIEVVREGFIGLQPLAE